MILGWVGVLLAVLDLLIAFPATRKWHRATSSTSSHPPSQPCCSAANSSPAGTSPHVPKRVSRGLALYFAYISYSPIFGTLPSFRVSSAQSLKSASIGVVYPAPPLSRPHALSAPVYDKKFLRTCRGLIPVLSLSSGRLGARPSSSAIFLIDSRISSLLTFFSLVSICRYRAQMGGNKMVEIKKPPRFWVAFRWLVVLRNSCGTAALGCAPLN